LATAALVLLAPQATARDTSEVLTAGGLERSYTVLTPVGAEREPRPRPAVIVLHGGGGSGQRVRGQMRMDPVAEREGFLVVYPDGVDKGWNDGRRDMVRARGKAGEADDVAFLVALARRLVLDGLARAGEVYVTGVSNGGMMSFRLACDAPEQFAGFAPVIANLPEDIAGSCQPRQARPMLIINGTEDPLVPWHGGGVGFRGERGRVLSTAATLEHWRTIGGCRGESHRSAVPDRDPGDGMRAFVVSASGCAAPLVLIEVEGGGHRIPGRQERATPVIDGLIGRQTRDLEAAEVIWRFFRSAGREATP
jgi:polyhydroxybutyrate depolymerase